MIDYKKAGVDIDKSNRFVKDIARMVSTTRRKEVMGNIGGFSGFMKTPKRYKSPILTSSTDGVGTKLMIAELLNKHTTVGIDLVAMCVNDIIVTGAEPLFFLDYFATGRLNNKKARDVIKGIVEGCKQANCALIGGETAEMPGMYKGEEYDLAGFCVGVVEEDKVIDGASVKTGDVIIGIQSSGVHSNGFSLVRRIFKKSELKGGIGREVLRPTIIYVKVIQDILKRVRIKSMAHITGGGFYDNIPRVLPQGKSALIYKESWPVPQIFKKIQKRAKISDREMFRTFNMGIGMAVVVSKDDVKKAQEAVKKSGLKSWKIGKVIKGKKEVII